jgi:hypothetical protein
MAQEQVTEGVRQCTAEDLADWYFRLNGFLTTRNYILHSDTDSAPRTDADIVGVRFPFRRELDYEDDQRFLRQGNKPLFVIGEVKRSECKLNGPWTNPQKKNLHYLLNAIGVAVGPQLDRMAEDLYTRYEYDDQHLRVEMAVIGSRPNEEFLKATHAPSQWLFSEMLSFIYKRFNRYWLQKKEHQNWNDAGKFLYKEAVEESDEGSFIRKILQVI